MSHHAFDQAVEANLVVYNTALSACATGMAWQKALQLFEDDAGCIKSRLGSHDAKGVSLGTCMLHYCIRCDLTVWLNEVTIR